MNKITKEEIEQFRTISELSFWINQIFSENISNEFITSVRLKSSDEIKTLMEEVIPISKFAKKYFSSNSKIKIKPIIGNQSYDAIIKGSDKISYLEVSRAVNGYDEKLRNEHLDKYGSVFAVGSIDKKGTKASGLREVIFLNNGISRKDEINNIKELIKKTILKKINKQKNYNAKTLLIITFQDIFWDILDTKDTEAIDNFINNEIINLQHSFINICILGEQNNYFRII